MFHSSTQQKTQANKITTLLLKENWAINVLILNINVLFLFSSIQQNQILLLLFLTNYPKFIVLQTGFFLSLRRCHLDRVHTMYTLQLPETNTFYMQCILGVIIII